MHKLLARTLLGLVALMGLTLLPAKAMADTGPWQWSDISDKLSARDGRPVWAIARAEPYWYLTDGQELWSGGHVWKTDGSIVTDITTDVRNAGLSRVDDIVSDGQSVVYLKNVVRSDRNFEALAYRNGSYTSVSYLWQQQMNQNEGLSSVAGKDGNWMIVTSLGHVLNWNQNNNNINSISLPGNPYVLGYSPMVYSTRHVSPIDGHLGFITTKAVPTSNGWLFVVPQNTGTYLRYYNYSNGYFNELTQISGMTNLQMIASNNNQVLLVGGDSVTVSNRAYYVDGTTVRAIKTPYDGVSFPSIAWNKTIAGYDGKSWMILSGKDLVRFDGTNFQTYGQTRDYFVQAIGNGNNTYLLGGASSDSSNSGPTSPLMAKLVRVDEGTGYGVVTPVVSYSAPSTEKVGTVNGMKNRITYWGWFNPNLKYHASDSAPKYTIGAQSNDGIRKIELYINDVWQKTCTPGNTKKNTECSMTINSADWPMGSNVGAFAKITSSKGRVAYVPALLIKFYDNSVKATMSVDNNTPYLYRGSTNNAYVTGYAGTGVNRIELYVNGTLKNTCYNVNSCTLPLNGYDYNVGSAVSFNGRVIANNGQEAWTWLGAYTVTDYGYNPNPNPTPSGDLSAWVWTDPSGDFSSSDYKTIKAQANAASGLQKIEIIVNGTVKQTCDFSRAYGTQSCQVGIYGSSYPNSSSIPVYVRATDYNGRQATSQTLYLNTNYSTNNSLSVWLESTGSDNVRRNETRTIRAYARSGNGLRQIDIYANDSLIGTCTYSDDVNTDKYCDRTFYANNYSVGTNVTIKAKATDRYGYTVWSTSNRQLYITDSYTNDSNGYVTVSTDRSSYNRNETVSVTAYASDVNGLKRVELYANDTLFKTCDLGSQTSANCYGSIIGSNYVSGTSLPIKARVTDVNYNTAWSDVKYVTVNGDYNSNYNTSVNLSFSPNQTNFNRNQLVTVTANATDANGIQKIRLFVNGSVINYCNPGYNTSASCSATFNTSNYPSVTSLPIQAEVTDNNGYVMTSNTTYLTLTNDTGYTGGTTTQDNVPGTLSISSNADSGYSTSQTVTFTATGSDDNGIQKIELYVNGELAKTCDNASSCSYTGGPYSTNTVTYAAKLIDSLGNATWNGYKVIYKK